MFNKNAENKPSITFVGRAVRTTTVYRFVNHFMHTEGFYVKFGDMISPHLRYSL